MSGLLVMVPDRVSALVAKGEIVPRYYNPDDLFSELHLTLTNDDAPDPGALQVLVGSAAGHVHNLPVPRALGYRTLGWRPLLLRRWAACGVELARRIRPRLVRCYGPGLNAVAALEIKRQLGIPYVLSLHGNPDVDYLRGRLARSTRDRIRGKLIERMEVEVVRGADMVLPVYTPIVPYLRRHGVTRYEVVYNAVGHGIVPKTSYAASGPRVRAVCVGRQQTLQKDPSHIIDAVAALPGVELLLIGDGDLHDALVRRAADSGAGDRIRFERSMPNHRVLEELRNADLYVYSSINYEISKTCIEAAITGLPVVINDRNGDPAEELRGGHFRLVSDAKDAYRQAIEQLAADEAARAELGRRARAHAERHWAPEAMERRVAEIYAQLALREDAPAMAGRR